MKVKDYLLDAIAKENINHVFLVPGGLIDPFIASLAQNQHLQPVIACHESGAAYMADGYSRVRNHLGICMCIGGPGILNTTTALATALTDGSALMVISGEVAADLEGRNTFQDSGPAATFSDVETLHSVTTLQLALHDPQLTYSYLHKLITKAMSPPNSPVHLVVPKDIQNADITTKTYQAITDNLVTEKLLDVETTKQCWKFFGDKHQIVILAGAGIEKGNASATLIEFAERFSIPVATTLRAKGVFPEDHHLSLGVFGYSGTRQAIETILSDEVDILLVLGSGLNQRDTLFWDPKMQPKHALIQVDINANAIGNYYDTTLAITGDCGEFLRYLLTAESEKTSLLTQGVDDREKWLAQIMKIPRLYDVENCTSDALPIHPARVLTELRKIMPRDTILVVDSGAHRAFAGHYWQAYAAFEYVSATNLGPMGWGIPASIGVKLAKPEKPCVLITGDGCMLMHGIEIHTAARYGINVIFVIINNHALGNVYLREKNVSIKAAAMMEIPKCDWKAFAAALGIHSIRVESPEDLTPAFQEALTIKNAPVVIDIICGKDYPTPVTPFAESQHEWHE